MHLRGTVSQIPKSADAHSFYKMYFPKICITAHALSHLYDLKFLTLDHLLNAKNVQSLFNTDTHVYLITLGYVDIVRAWISVYQS